MLWVTPQLSGSVARELPAKFACSGRGDAADKPVLEGLHVAIRRGPGALRERRLTAEKAGELLGISGRHFRPLIVRKEEEHEASRDRRFGKPSPRGPFAHGLDPWGAPAAKLTRIWRVYQERCRNFTVKHFHEQLRNRHDYKLGYTVTRCIAGDGTGGEEQARRRVSPEVRAAAVARHDAVAGRVIASLDPEGMPIARSPTNKGHGFLDG